MTEIHFIVEEAPEGGFTARAVGADIFTEADDLPALHEQVRDAVRCHFDEGKSLVLLDGHGRFKARLEAPVSGNVLLRQS